MDPRYEMEHTVLPSLLFQQTQDLIAVAGAHGARFFSDSYRAYFNGQGMDCPYGEEAFSLCRKEGTEAAVWILRLPQPQSPGHCRDVYKRQPGNKPWLIGSCEPMTRAGTRRI